MKDYTINIFKDIEQHRELIKKQKNEITEKQMIVDSLMDSMAHRVQQIATPYSDKMLCAAWHEQNKPTKKERTMFEFVKNDLFGRLFDEKERKEVKFISIVPVICSGNCAYNFQFKYKEIIFEIAIPNTCIADTSNILNMWYGMYILRYEKKKHIWDHITESYYLDDIAKAIKEFTEREN